MHEKTCIREDCDFAGRPQPIVNFSINKGYGDGRKARCKSCMKKSYALKASANNTRALCVVKNYDSTMSTLHQRQIMNSVSRQLSGIC